jgi:hypothetical protein
MVSGFIEVNIELKSSQTHHHWPSTETIGASWAGGERLLLTTISTGSVLPTSSTQYPLRASLGEYSPAV